MRFMMLIIGALMSGLYTLAGAAQFVHSVCTNNPASSGGMSMIAANSLPLCIGGVIFLSCLGGLRRKQAAPNSSLPTQ
jgi:hypothetical protein